MPVDKFLGGISRFQKHIYPEHQELFGLCDRILVMGEGQLRGELAPADYSEEKLLSLAIARSASHTKAA